MERYRTLKEKRLNTFKAWYNPSSDWFYQFSDIELHNEISREQLHMTSEETLRKGYIRVYAYNKTLNIESKNTPRDIEFNSVKFKLEQNTFPAHIKFVTWDTGKKVYFFKRQSFFHAESIQDGSNLK